MMGMNDMPKQCIDCGCIVWTMTNVSAHLEDRNDYVAICVDCGFQWKVK